MDFWWPPLVPPTLILLAEKEEGSTVNSHANKFTCLSANNLSRGRPKGYLLRRVLIGEVLHDRPLISASLALACLGITVSQIVPATPSSPKSSYLGRPNGKVGRHQNVREGSGSLWKRIGKLWMEWLRYTLKESSYYRT